MTPVEERAGNLVALVVWATVAVRVFVAGPPDGQVPWYVGGLLAFLAIQLLVLWRRTLSVALLYVAFAVQAAVVLVLLSLDPHIDVLTALLALEAFQAAVLLSGRARYVWVGVLLALIAVSLVLGLGLLHGLALAFVPMAVGLVFAMFAVTGRDLEAARARSERMVADLREARANLEAYAGQVGELAAIEERARVAAELEASVSRTIDKALAAARAARAAAAAPGVGMPGEAAAAPGVGAPPETSVALERLQGLTQEALAQMRHIVAELRPPSASTPGTASAPGAASSSSPGRT